MKTLLEEFNISVNNVGGVLDKASSDKNLRRYRRLLEEAKLECPPPDESKRNGKRGRLKRSKARNLLERFINYEDDVLRFMDNADAPFTNNQDENDLRMTKVQQKFRSR